MRVPLLLLYTLTDPGRPRGHATVEELGRERERNEGGVSKREKMGKTWIKRVVTVIVVI